MIEICRPRCRAANQFGTFILKHDGGRLTFIGQFDGFHEFLTALRAANPQVELRGC